MITIYALTITAMLRFLPSPAIVTILANDAGMQPQQAACMVRAESGWNAHAVGALGERGLWQIHPETWAWARERMGAEQSFALAFDEIENTRTALWLIANGYGEWWASWENCQ